jgi:hypothetical protein
VKSGGGGSSTTSDAAAACVSGAASPVIVSVDGPVGVLAALVTVSVDVPDAVIVSGENDAVTSAGRPDALSLTEPVKPLSAPIVTVNVVPAPWMTDLEAGLAEIVKSGTGAGLIVSVALVERTTGPLVPVNVIAGVPVGVEALVASVTVDVPDVVIDAGENVAVAPWGSPVALSPTVPVKPFTAPIVTVKVVLLPCVMVREAGVRVIVKSAAAAALTVNVAVVDRASVPLVPVMVTVEDATGVLPDVVTVSVELPDPVSDDGEKPAVAPAGSPEALRLTGPENPLSAPTVTV